jgi:hypothetical protein
MLIYSSNVDLFLCKVLKDDIWKKQLIIRFSNFGEPTGESLIYPVRRESRRVLSGRTALGIFGTD